MIPNKLASPHPHMMVTRVQNSVSLTNDSQPLLPWPQTPTTPFSVSNLTIPVTPFKYKPGLWLQLFKKLSKGIDDSKPAWR